MRWSSGPRKCDKMALEAGADGCGFVSLREDGVERGFDVAIGNAAGAELAGNAEAPLAARVGVLAGVIEGVAGVVEIVLFAQARDHAIDVSSCLSARRPRYWRISWMECARRIRARRAEA